MRKFIYTIITLFVLQISACTNDFETEYSRRAAYFLLPNSHTVFTLNTALNNMGEFCTIENEPNQFRFRSITNNDVVNKTAISNYTGFNMGLSGFIVGTPNIPQIGEVTSKVVCYDRACPNCYEDNGIIRNLDLQEGGNAQCKTCTRLYNLNNNGLIVTDTTGIRLYKYRVSYLPYTLIIRN